jgi:hypothetical protein
LNLPSVTYVGYLAFGYNSLTSINLPSLIEASDIAFFGNPLTEVNLPLATSIGYLCFSSNSNPLQLTNVYIPSCINLGDTVGDDNVFYSESTFPAAITLTIPSALMTCNSGLPDGDIQYLQANSTVTIITV